MAAGRAWEAAWPWESGPPPWPRWPLWPRWPRPVACPARVAPGEETGGPLVNLSGQAVGISLAGAGTGLRHTSFAVPINQALAVARGIQAAYSR